MMMSRLLNFKEETKMKNENMQAEFTEEQQEIVCEYFDKTRMKGEM